MTGIRRLTEEDLKEVQRLDEFAFQFEPPDGERGTMRPTERPEDMLGYFIEGRLASKLHLLPLRVNIAGSSLPMGGIASVATWPEYRRRGLVARLIAHALGDMREQGWPVSMLAPFSFSFYRRYGFEFCIERKHYTLNVNQLPTFGHPQGTFEAVSDWRELQPVYGEFAKRYTGMLERGGNWWSDRVLRDRRLRAVAYRNADGVARGYILYRIRESKMHIAELAALGEADRAAMWSFIHRHDSMVKSVTVVAPTDDPLPFLLPDPRVLQEIRPYFMARVVDVGRFLAAYPFAPSGEPSAFILEIKDAHAPWNDAHFTVRIDPDGRAVAISQPNNLAGGGAGLLPGNGSGEVQSLSCDIRSFTAMAFGAQSPAFLRDCGRLQANDRALRAWEARLPKQRLYLADFF